jgi:hypothetical protein
MLKSQEYFFKSNIKFKLLASVLLSISLLIPANISLSQISSSDQQTVWQLVDNSLDELLDDGWKLLDQSITRSVTNPAPGISGVNTTMFSYTLGKNGKHITCIVIDPRSSEIVYSRCFRIN